MPDRQVPVHREVARDESFRRIVRRGVESAPPEVAHSVHVEVEGLAPWIVTWDDDEVENNYAGLIPRP